MSTQQGSSAKLKNNHLGINGKGSSANKVTLKTSGKLKKQVIPVIYIPGIFASRLEQTDGDPIWDPDSSLFMLSKMTKGILSVFSTLGKSKAIWKDKQIEKKINLLHSPGQPMVGSKIDLGKAAELQSGEVFKLLLDRNKLDPWEPDDEEEIDAFALELYQVRRKRGWYGILGEYIKIMESITLTEHPEFVFPTFGFGYDWRKDITDSSNKFSQWIDDVIAVKEYPEYGELGKDYEIEPSKKVIIVTHSMGSIVTRFTSEHCGAKNKIHSVMHLNQPTTGAPILFRRFLFGTEIEKKRVSLFSFDTLKNISDNVLNEILGTTSYHFTKTAGTLVGPLQLLPTNQHRLDNSLLDDMTNVVGKNNWLDVQHNYLKPLKPTNTLDIYDDVYKNDRLGIFAYKRYDENGKPKPYTKEEFKVAELYDQWEGEFFMEKLAKDVTELEKKTYDITEKHPDTSPYSEDNYRLQDSQLKVAKYRLKNADYKKKVHKTINSAKKFHQALGLDKHSNTYVSGSINKDTFIELNYTLNADNMLAIPFVTSKTGDGTVPLTSQEILIGCGGKTTGPIISKGDTGHASMPKHKEALEQVSKYLIEVAITLSKNNVKP